MSDADPALRLRACVQCPGHGPAGAALDGLRQGARHRHAHRRRAGGSPYERGRSGSGLRLLCVFGAQDVRADRHRRALRPRIDAGADASLAGRRRHDPHRGVRQDDLQRPALQVRGGDARTLPGASAWVPPCNISGPWTLRAHMPTRKRCSPTRPTRSAASMACGSSARRATRPASSPSWCRAFTRMISAPYSMRKASQCVPAITAPCPSWTTSNWRARRALRLLSTTPSRKSTD